MSRIILLFLTLISFFASSQENFPIMAFHGVQSGKVKDFAKFKEAGFNINLNVYYSTSDIIRDLKAAEKAGVKLFVYSDSLMLEPEKIIMRIKDYPAFYGTYIADEPSVNQFSMLGWRIQGIKNFDKNGKFYINLFPNYASNEQLGIDSYLNYLQKFASEVKSDFISFDYYPIRKNKVDLAWYKNLEDIRNVSKSIKKPFWGFANSTIFGPFGQPTLAGLKLQQFGNLLYGAKGLQYFTYWTLEEDFRQKNDFKYSIVYEDGSPTPTYNLVKTLNFQIRNLTWIFANGTVTDIYHDGPNIPTGTMQLSLLPDNFKVFNKTNASILISMLQTSDKKYIIVQNKSITDSIAFIYKVNSGVRIIDSQTGVEKSISTDQSSSTILPGDILIFSQTK